MRKRARTFENKLPWLGSRVVRLLSPIGAKYSRKESSSRIIASGIVVVINVPSPPALEQVNQKASLYLPQESLLFASASTIRHRSWS